MIFGYARVSTDDQNLSLQIDALAHYGIDSYYSGRNSYYLNIKFHENTPI